jgi:hypothetical protein
MFEVRGRKGEGKLEKDSPNVPSRNANNLREAPVSVRSNDGRDELGEAEREEERSRGALDKEPRVGSSDEDQGLRDLGDLEVDQHVHLRVVSIDAAEGLVSDGGEDCQHRYTQVDDAKLVREEGRVDDDDVEHDRSDREVHSVGDSVSEDLCEVPRVGGARGEDAVDGEGHDRSVVEEGDDKDCTHRRQFQCA